MSTTNDNHFEVDETLQYAICEKSWFYAQSKKKQKELKNYKRFCVIVPDGFFQWVDLEKYKLALTPLAQMWLDLHSGTYVIDSVRGDGYMLERVSKDTKLGTKADYWFLDKGDVRLTAAIDSFAEEIGEAIDGFPFEKVETRGRKKKSAKDEEEQDESTIPGTRKYIAKERNIVMGTYKHILEDRYSAYAGYDRDRIVKRIKGMAANNAVRMNDLQRTGSLVPCRNGVYDLIKKEFRSAFAEDYISVYAPTDYVEGAKDPVVEKFLKEFTCDRKDLQDFLAQVMGVALDKNMITRTMCQLWGPTTTNGKSTFIKAMMATLGKSSEHGLAVELSPTVIGIGKNTNDDSAVTPGLAMIGDSKIIFASEPPKNMKVNWALVKRLTGGDTVNVNAKYKESYSLDARAKIVMDTNHSLRVDDQTIFDRDTMQIIPCDLQVKEKDKALDSKLSTESAKSAWLAWMILGYQSYIDNKKNFYQPDCVKEALEQNRLDSDRIGRFISENYLVTNNTSKKIKVTELFDKYCEWCDQNGYDHPGVRKEFAKYFINKPNTYVMGKRDNQDAVCGLVSAFTSPLARKPVISGDPVDWFIQNHMKMNSQDKTDEEIPLAKVHADYKKKVEAAGGTALDIWPLYGVLLGKGFKVTMGAPGVVAEIKVSGWHLKTDAERETERFEKMQIKKNELEKSVNQALKKVSETDKKAGIILRNILKTNGLDNMLRDMEPDVREVLMTRIVTGKGWDGILGDVAAKQMD